MLNHIRADIWKLFRRKSFYIIIISILVMMLLMGVALEITTRISYEDYIAMQEKQTGVKIATNEQIAGANQYYEYQESVRQGMNATFYLSLVTSESGILYLGFCLFFSLFLLMDYQRGYLKNLITLVQAKSRWLLAKLFTAAVAALVFLTFILLFASAYGYWRVGELGYTLSMIVPFMSGQFVALLALAAILIFFVVIFQQTLPTILLGLVIARNLHSLLLKLVDQFNFLPISLAENSLGSRVYGLTIASSNQINGLLIHGILVILIASLAARLIFKKADIRC